MPSVTSHSSKPGRRRPGETSHPAGGVSGPFEWLSTRKQAIYASILCISTLVIYLPVHHHPFSISDDEQYVVNNPHLQGGLGWDTVHWAFTTNDLANWHPITWLSHAADVGLFQLNPAGHHDVNLLLQLINVLLLFWVFARATGLAGRSFMVAALFALHPINVETVAWVAERKSLLSMLFFLLALGAYRAYAAQPRVGRYMGVMLAFALGLMAKPQIITLPFVLLLWDYWPLRRMFPSPDAGGNAKLVYPPQTLSWLLLEKVPLLLLSAGSAAVTMWAQRSAGAMRYYPFDARLQNAVVAYVRYIGKAVWPAKLTAFYPHERLSSWQVWASSLLLVVITLAVLYFRRQRYLAVGWFWFLGTLVPMIGLVQVGEQAMADRYAYVSFIGLFLMICWGIADWAAEPRLASKWLAVPAAMVLVILAVLTYRQLDLWSDNVKLWEHTLTTTNGSFEAEENLGVALLEAGDAEDAMSHFERVVATEGNGSDAWGRERVGYAAVAHLYLGAYAQQHGQPDSALDHYKAVLKLAQDFRSQNVYGKVPPVLFKMEATALGNMGYVYSGLGSTGEAKASFQQALQLDPRGAREWVGLGVVDQRMGDMAGAVNAFSRAAALKATDVSLLLLAQALERTGQVQDARSARDKAALVSPNLEAAQRTVDRMLGH